MKIKIFDLLYFFAVLFTVVLFFNYFPLNEDSKWILHCADEMTKGAVLYVDKIDVNPPLIFIYSIFAVFISKITFLSLINSYILLVILIICFSLYLCWKILDDIFKDDNSKIRIYLYTISFILFLSVSYDFGEREHLLVIFIFPYILMSMYRYEIDLPKSYIITIAIFASLGFNLKPHFFLIFVLVELIFLIHSKKLFSFLRVDFFIIVLSGFFYLLLIYFFFYEYISFMIPFAIETYTDVFNRSYISLFKNFEIFTFLSILFLYVFFAKNKFSLQNLTLLGTIFASLLIYLIQQKGWSYHTIPIYTFSILLLFNIFLTCPKKQIYSIVFIPLILYMMYFNTFIRHSNRHVELKPIIKEFPDDASIYILTTDIGGAQPLLNQSKQVWASRFPSLFMLPSMIKNNQKVMDYTFDSIYEDLLKYKPDIIVFPAFENRFDYFGYFTSKDARLDIFYKKYYTLRKKDNFIILYKKI